MFLKAWIERARKVCLLAGQACWSVYLSVQAYWLRLADLFLWARVSLLVEAQAYCRMPM